MKRAVHTLALLLLSLSACIGGLDSPALVVTPRILAIVADHPEAAPGEDIHLGVMAFDPEGRALTYRWSACLDVAQVLEASQLSTTEAPDTCRALDSTSFEAVVPGERTQTLIETVLLIAGAGGFPPEAIDAILGSAGLSFEVYVDVVAPDGTVLVSGVKRLALTTRPSPTTNPPAIDYLVADVAVRSAVPGVGEPFACVAARPIVIHASERVILAARDTPSEWIETYPIFDFTGGIREGTENAYYSWYATAGELSSETTRLPDRDVFYRAPVTLGPVRLFFVLRDGHLGARACFLDAQVIEPLPDPEP